MDTKMIHTDYSECMRQSYLNYSMSVITARALPDIRDGLKPVQRRTLYAMSELGLSSDKPHRKCARIVGDTMGKYHPHGDSSIYEALVVMSQDFKKNEPLAEPHGNFGSIEGDGAAAMRYTEARLRKLTEKVYLADLEKNVVDFIPNFDETEKEPVVLPVRIPNILINGAEGIAVGMTTSIPSHNLNEVLECAAAYIDNSDITTEELLNIMPGPDFSTGGIVANQEDLVSIYEKGTGKIRLRGKVVLEEGKKRGEKDKLVITEIPYTMIGEGIRRFLSDTAQLAESKKLPEITDISNESSKEGIRIVLELKKGSDVERVKNILFKKTRLEDTFGVNMIAIVDGRPTLLSLKSILKHFVDFQIEINQRKYTWMLEEEQKKKEVQEGLIQAVDIIDLIIEIIRGSKTQAQAKACLMGDPSGVTFRHRSSAAEAAKLGFTERQAQAILDLRLSRLIGLEIAALNKAYKDTCTRIRRYEKILGSRKNMLNAIKEELKKIQDEFGHERRTVITSLEEAHEIKEEIKEEELLFLMDRFGYVKTVEAAALTKNSDQLQDYRYVFLCKNTGKVQLFTREGKMHQIKVMEIPFQKLKEKGVPVDNISNYDSSKEELIFVCACSEHPEQDLIFATAGGLIKKTPAAEFVTNTRTIAATKLGNGDELVYVDYYNKKQVILHSEKGSFLRFASEEINSGKRNTLGQKGMALAEDDSIKEVWQVTPGEDNQIQTDRQVIDLKRIRLSARGQRGIKLRLQQ
ncbi:MAG: DNA topoisomerase (ATP-hydrolyzing) [Lachnospiraceae bacterium]|nr:DNA topoisomerase (ATP-hydrolyzing) [Lachnospiraceae bacterium]